MKSGISKITQIPSDGLNFITNRKFSNDSSKKIMGEDWFTKTSVMKFFPAVVADLDYRLMYQNDQHNHVFERTLIGNTVIYQIQGEGRPFILFHGLFSDGADLFPLGLELHEKTGQPVWILDLPGLGRSPFKREKNLLDLYLNVVKELMEKLLMVHIGLAIPSVRYSSGSVSARVPRYENTITLLQPPVAKRNSNSFNAPQFMNKWALKLATANLIERYLLGNGLFENTESIPEHYIAKVSRSFTSPRILNTTVQLNRFLLKDYQGDFNKVQRYNLHIIWGDQDRRYFAPLHLGKVDIVPYGHHFPLSHPRETADLVIKNSSTSR